MKKKIAVYGNGCAYEYSGTTLEGIQDAAQSADVDLYMFINFSGSAETKEDNEGEVNIYRLPDMKEFDGVILIPNQFNSPKVEEGFRQYVVENGLRCVSLESDLEGVECVLTDNSAGTYQLANHLIEEHGVKEIVYIGGPDALEENKARFAGIKRAFDEHGLSIPEDHIIHGNWSYLAGRMGITEWIKAHDGHLPDGVMCANDYMAMGVCIALNRLGYEVPRDVVVTGYDNLEEARTFSPGISSVNRSSYEVGYDGMKHLLAMINGEETKPCEWVETRMSVEESCGCFNLLKNSSLRNKAYNETFTGSMDTVDFARRARILESDTATITTQEELEKCIQGFLQADEYIQDCDTAIMLDSCFMSSVHDPSVSLRLHGYSSSREVLFCQKDGRLVPVASLKGAELMPDIFLDDEKNHTYIFSPLHTREKCLGYIVFVDCLEKVKEALLYNWMNSMHQVLSNVHKNMQLANMNNRLYEASVTDAQTGLLNRNGYNRRVIPFLAENHNAGRQGAVILIDINRMKRINDVYGHQQGDLAVALIGESIRHVIPEDFFGVRYGGDEFLVAGSVEREEEIQSLMENMEETLENKNREMDLAYHLTISHGYDIIPAGGDFALEEHVHRADEMMYKIKQQRHAAEEMQ